MPSSPPSLSDVVQRLLSWQAMGTVLQSSKHLPSSESYHIVWHHVVLYCKEYQTLHANHDHQVIAFHCLLQVKSSEIKSKGIPDFRIVFFEDFKQSTDNGQCFIHGMIQNIGQTPWILDISHGICLASEHTLARLGNLRHIFPFYTDFWLK